MKLKRLFLGAILALIFTPISNTFASVQDFYFEDFTADYYLTKLEDDTSNLHVKEVLTAVFPETNQNHGITRTIPYTNQGGVNKTVTNEAALNLTVLRNGEPENINKIVAEDGYYTVYIGSASEYVHGEQVYTLEYDYTDVITEFDKNGVNVSGVDGAEKAFQELYWDTNGTGWSQKFNKVTANLHMSADVYEKMDKKAWCYVGSYGEKGEDRCEITLNGDGFSFVTKNLAARENLTFVTEFEPGTFKVILEKNYILVIILAIEILLIAIFLTRKYLKWRKIAKPQRDLYKSLFDTPQYQPPEDKNVCVAEAEQIYIKRAKSSYVATLLELVVDKKVTMKKVGDEKYDWVVVLNVEPGELTGPQKQMMNILSGNGGLAKGDEIRIEKHTATKYLAGCASSYKSMARNKMVRGGYLKTKEDSVKASGGVTLIAILLVMIAPWSVIVIEGLYDRFVPSGNAVVVGGVGLLNTIVAIFIGYVVVSIVLSRMIHRYEDYTEKGIRLVKYLEGLELYIKMAEADRLKFLQSVEGVDTSNVGIVKLYEKLLPWASLFGAEESWVKELAKYYEIEDTEGVVSSDVLDGIMIANITHDISRTISSSTHYVEPSSSGGSWSSGGSGGGGGGGGFSGGGGGGGGGGGW